MGAISVITLNKTKNSTKTEFWHFLIAESILLFALVIKEFDSYCKYVSLHQ